MIKNLPPFKPDLYKRFKPVAILFSIIVLLVIASLRRFHIDSPVSFKWLAAFHSSLNAITSLGLIWAYYLIRVKKNVQRHKQVMILNMCLSGLFLISYVVYHLTTPETVYCREGISKTIYLSILVSHILLAAIIMPIVLFTFLRAYTGYIPIHKKMARWAFPLWLYVAVTGPILFLFIRTCF